MRRMLMLFAAVALLALSLAPVVQAQVPGEQGGLFDAGFTLEIEANDPEFPGACDFPVLIEVSGKGKNIELPNGSFIMTSPGLEATVTNTLTGAQETYNVTGSVRPQPTNAEGDDVTELRGRNITTDPNAGFVVAIGNFSFAFDHETGELSQPLSGEGQLIDICEALA